jgi:hypothetical protein
MFYVWIQRGEPPTNSSYAANFTLPLDSPGSHSNGTNTTLLLYPDFMASLGSGTVYILVRQQGKTSFPFCKKVAAVFKCQSLLRFENMIVDGEFQISRTGYYLR